MTRIRLLGLLVLFTAGTLLVAHSSFGQDPGKEPEKTQEKGKEPEKKDDKGKEPDNGKKEPDKGDGKEPDKKDDKGKEPDKGKKDDKAKENGKEKVAYITVWCDTSAKLTLDSHESKQTGTKREFVTPPLPPDKQYKYTLSATWQDDKGSDFKRMAVAVVSAGKSVEIDMRQSYKSSSSSQIVFQETPQAVIDKMLAMAKVTKSDIVYDLGCGNGKIVANVALKHGAKAVGIDIDPVRIKECEKTLKDMKVPAGLVEIRQGDALKVPDFGKATVVTLYMLPEFMEHLEPIMKKELKPGTRVVSHWFEIEGWKAVDTQTVVIDADNEHTIYMYIVEEPKEKKEDEKKK